MNGHDRRTAERAVFDLLTVFEPHPERSGLKETPARVVRAMEAYTCGYEQDPAAVLKVFSDGAEQADEAITVSGIEVWSTCEHHLAPFFGHATVSYIPDADEPRIVGLSKLARLVDIFARRFQVQERLTGQVADAIMQHLKPEGCGVVVSCRHLCMEARGVRSHGTVTHTTALRGSYKEDPAVRSEFLAIARK